MDHEVLHEKQELSQETSQKAFEVKISGPSIESCGTPSCNTFLRLYGIQLLLVADCFSKCGGKPETRRKAFYSNDFKPTCDSLDSCGKHTLFSFNIVFHSDIFIQRF